MNKKNKILAVVAGLLFAIAAIALYRGLTDTGPAPVIDQAALDGAAQAAAATHADQAPVEPEKPRPRGSGRIQAP